MPRHRRTATRVKDGRVQKKNTWEPAERSIHATDQDEIHIERRDPGKGCRHLVTVAQLRAFLRLLPDWEEVTVGLQVNPGRGESYAETYALRVMDEVWPAYARAFET